jgi:hypothetical protein
MFKNMFKKLPAISLCIALIGCGGGGGSAPAPNTEDGLSGPLTITGFNATDVATLGFSASEAAVGFADIMLIEVQALLQAFFTMRESACQSGSKTTHVVDADASSTLTAGDEVSIEYNDCVDSVIGGLTNGTLRLNVISSLGSGPSDYTVSGSLTLIDISINAIQGLATLSAISEVLFSANSMTRSIVLEIESFVVAFAGVTERLMSAIIVKDHDLGTDRYILSIDGSADSEFLGGSFTLETVIPFSGPFDSYPDQGFIEFGGGSNTAFRVSANDGSFFSGDTSFSIYYLDNNGDGIFEEGPVGFSWSHMVEGPLWDGP